MVESALAAERAPRLLTIDLDETVWPCRAVIERAEGQLYRWLRERAPRVTDSHSMESLREHRLRLREAHPELAHDITALRLASLGQLLAAHGYHRGRARAALALFLEERNRVEPYEDVAPVLRVLARHYRLVSVTNGNAAVARTPLGGHFHLSLSAADVGAPKPSPALFEAALRYAGVSPGEAVHVGDDPYLDVEPARQLGMRTVWMNRTGAPWPDELRRADATVTDFFRLQRWLETIS